LPRFGRTGNLPGIAPVVFHGPYLAVAGEGNPAAASPVDVRIVRAGVIEQLLTGAIAVHDVDVQSGTRPGKESHLGVIRGIAGVEVPVAVAGQLAQSGFIDADGEYLLIGVLRSAALAGEGKLVSGMIQAEVRNRLVAAPYQFDPFGRQVQSIDAPVSLVWNSLVD
jgi:hypothetical protein